MKKPGFVIAVSALALLLASCVPSENPLSDPHDFAADSRLKGFWYAASDDEVQFLHFLQIDNSFMDVDMVSYEYEESPGNSPPVEWGRYRVFRTEIGGVQYLNTKPIAGAAAEDNGWSGYLIVKYKISEDGSLTIWLMSIDALARDIKNGKVAGNISDRGWVTALTDSSANLRDYIRKTADLFPEKFATTYRKIPSKISTR